MFTKRHDESTLKYNKRSAGAIASPLIYPGTEARTCETTGGRETVCSEGHPKVETKGKQEIACAAPSHYAPACVFHRPIKTREEAKEEAPAGRAPDIPKRGLRLAHGLRRAQAVGAEAQAPGRRGRGRRSPVDVHPGYLDIKVADREERPPRRPSARAAAQPGGVQPAGTRSPAGEGQVPGTEVRPPTRGVREDGRSRRHGRPQRLGLAPRSVPSG